MDGSLGTYVCLASRPATFDIREGERGGVDLEGGGGEEEEVYEGCCGGGEVHGCCLVGFFGGAWVLGWFCFDACERLS
jgi:hypothetical protein